MARTKEFDPDAALGSAIELFWQRGYEATSMSDLVKHLGIGRASIYATFGSKHALYLKALDRYGERSDGRLLHELSGAGAALPAVRAVVRRYVEESAGENGDRGCFITNTATELAAGDPQSARLVLASWDRLETLLLSALIRAQAQGELPAERDPRTLARLLVVLLQGVRVVGKADGDPARMRDAAEQALAILG